MKKYIFAARNGIHVVDLNKTLTQIEVACGFLHETILNGGTVLFVGTKKQAQQEMKDAATRAGMPYVVDRWLGGTLTNLRTIRNSVKRMQEIDRLLSSPEGEHLPKKEVASLRREQNKLHRNLDGIVSMERAPAAMFVIDIQREAIAIHEAHDRKPAAVAAAASDTGAPARAPAVSKALRRSESSCRSLR